MNDPHALARRFPAARALPHAPLGDFPTPVEHLERAGEELGLPDLFIKRDDRSGKEYGGNKVRKLEFALAHARAQGHDDIVTIGAIGSHHVLATSIYARQLGMRPSAQHWPQPVTPHVRDNLRALSTTQPTLRLIGHPVEVPFHVFKRHLNDWLADRPRTYFLSGGGSSPHGVLGYVNAALELAEQIDAGLAPEPDVVFVAAGTNGTYAGLLLGAKMAGLRAKFIAVRVVEKIVTNTANVLRLTHQAA
ncbi:MAG: pyridoxal-phosphate dependent enzyme, partial [Myxococcota bacterium]